MCSFSELLWFCQLRWNSFPVAFGVMAGIMIYVAYSKTRREHYEKQGHVTLPGPLLNLKLTKEELKTYNAANPKRKYLLGFQGKLYDVSCCPDDFGPNGIYKDLTGTDITWYIEKTVRNKIRSFDAFIKEYKKRLEDRFFVAGILIDDKKKLEEEEKKKEEMEKKKKAFNDPNSETDFKELTQLQKLQMIYEAKTEGVQNNEKMPENLEDLEKTLIWPMRDEAQSIRNLNYTI